MLTVNDLIGLNYANLRNPQPADMGPGLSYQIDPAVQGGRRLVSDIKPAIDPGANRNFPPSNLMPDPNYPEFAQVDMGATGTIPTAANINAQPLIADTSGIAPILQQNMDYGTSIDNFQGFTDKKDFSTARRRKTPKGLKQALGLLFGAMTGIPINLLASGQGTLSGIKSLNQRLRGTDFAQATSLADYLDMQRYGGLQGRLDAAARNMAQARGIQKQMSLRPSGQVTAEDNYRGGASSASEAASRSAATRSSRTAGIAAARGSNYGSRLHG